MIYFTLLYERVLGRQAHWRNGASDVHQDPVEDRLATSQYALGFRA